MWDIRSERHLNSNLTKSHLLITYCSVVISFWNFTEHSTIIAAPCSNFQNYSKTVMDELSYIAKSPRATSQYKEGLSRYGISIKKIRRSWDRLIFIMGVPILVRRHLYIKTVPGSVSVDHAGQDRSQWETTLLLRPLPSFDIPCIGTAIKYPLKPEKIPHQSLSWLSLNKKRCWTILKHIRVVWGTFSNWEAGLNCFVPHLINCAHHFCAFFSLLVSLVFVIDLRVIYLLRYWLLHWH